MSSAKEHVKKSIESNLSPELKRNTGSPAQRTLLQSWLSLPRKTRLVFSFTLFGSALAGLWLSDKVEEKMPAGSSTVTKKNE